MFRQSSACKSEKHLETNLTGHFLHSCLELTWIEISRGHVEAHLTIASYMQSDLLSRVKSPECEKSVVLALCTDLKNVKAAQK